MLRRMTRQLSTQVKQTYKLQDSLPSLPVPTLEQTKAKYLKSIKPYVQGAEEYAQQEALITDFFDGQGAELQKRLVTLGEQKRNWLSTYWDDYSYLQYNDPIVPYVSYFYGHKDLPHNLQKIGTNQLYKSVAIIDKALDFAELIKDESLPPEVIRGTPFCMNSFKYLFSGSRIPFKKGQDSNVVYDLKKNGFIVIGIHKGFYKLFTHDPATGDRLPVSTIFRQLLEIQRVSSSSSSSVSSSIGVLTSLPRDEWFETYQELIKSPISQHSLESIHRSTFILVLEDDVPVTLEERAHFCWHGDGLSRFWDKPVQFFVAKNGYSGFIGEHSKMDGTTTLLLNEFINRSIRKITSADEYIESFETAKYLEVAPVPLRFEISSQIKSDVLKAKQKLDAELNNHDVKVWRYERYGKSAMKLLKVSPDAFVQLIIQLAIFKMTGTSLPTYEAASTRKFYRGRTETNRSVSEESFELVRKWDDFKTSDSQRFELFQKAVKSHLNYIKDASNGLGVDRHLLGLQFQLNPDEKPHKFLSDPLKVYSATWLVSTSQISSEYHDAWGWSEVNPIGWGLAYQIHNDDLQINICTRKSSGNKPSVLEYYLGQAADEIYSVLVKHNQSKL